MKIAVGNSRMDKKWKNQDISWADLCARCGSTIHSSTPTTARPKASVSALHKPLASRVPFLNLRDIGGCRLRYSMLNTGMSRYAITKP